MLASESKCSFANAFGQLTSIVRTLTLLCLYGMRDVDVVIAATSSPETLLSRADVENVMKARGQRPLLLIDLSVPRNVDSAVVSLDNVSLYNIDGLEALAREGLRNRERELGACHQIIEADVTALIGKLRAESERRYLSDPWCRSSRPHHLAVDSGPLLQAPRTDELCPRVF